MELITAEKAAPILGFENVQQVWDAARRKLIPCVRIGRRVRFDPEALKEWAASGGTSINEQSQPSCASGSVA